MAATLLQRFSDLHLKIPLPLIVLSFPLRLPTLYQLTQFQQWRPL